MTYHHLSVLVHRQAEKYGDKIALKYRDYETAQWIPISWKEFSQTVRRTANAMVALGIEPQENIGIFSQNKPECLFTDFGAFANRAVTIPLYATSSPVGTVYHQRCTDTLSVCRRAVPVRCRFQRVRILPVSAAAHHLRPCCGERSARHDFHLF